MKNRRLQWILLPAVLLIWGIVGYRLYSGVNGEVVAHTKVRSRPEVVVGDVDTLDYVLAMEYPDPFLKNQKRHLSSGIGNTSATTQKAKPKALVKVTVKPMEVRWPDILYKGQIEKKEKAQPLCILEINKVVYFMRKGEREGKLKLLQVYKDSIQVEYLDREKKTIKRQ